MTPGSECRVCRHGVLLGVLLVYIVSIVCLPRIGDQLRTEDILTPVVGLAAVWGLMRALRDYAAPLLTAACYFYYVLIVTLLSIALAGNPAATIVIYGKELQYFLGFLLMLAIVREPACMRWVRAVLWLCVWFGALTGVVLLLAGVRGYYGIAYITEPYSPSLSALIYFNLAVFVLYLRATSASPFVRRYSPALCGVLLLLLVMVGSRTGMAMAGLFVMLMFFLHVRRPLLWIGGMAAAAGAIVTIYLAEIQAVGRLISALSVDEGILEIVVRRTGSLLTEPGETVEVSRLEAWQDLYGWATAQKHTTIFGCGRGCSNVFRAATTGEFALKLSGDSQYLVGLLETGAVGLGLFAVMLGALLVRARPDVRRIYVAYVFSCLVAGIFFELFMLSKGGGLFWLFSAMAISARETRTTSSDRTSHSSRLAGTAA